MIQIFILIEITIVYFTELGAASDIHKKPFHVFHLSFNQRRILIS